MNYNILTIITRSTGGKSCFHQVGNTIESLLKGSVSQKCIETGPFNNVSIVFHP